MNESRVAAFALGKGALAGGSAIAIGALCFYGLGLSSDSQTIVNQSMCVEHIPFAACAHFHLPEPFAFFPQPHKALGRTTFESESTARTRISEHR